MCTLLITSLPSLHWYELHVPVATIYANIVVLEFQGESKLRQCESQINSKDRKSKINFDWVTG